MHNHRIQQFQLKNGARLTEVIVPDLSYSIVSAWYKAGARFDPAGKEGLAHFFEHLLTMKTKSFPDRSKRLEELDAHGIEFNAFTDHSGAYFYHAQLPQDTERSLELLLDGLQNSVIEQEDLAREKVVIEDEQISNYENPSAYAWRFSMPGVWPQAMLGRDFFGNQEIFSQFTLDDINAFYDEYYAAANTDFLIIHHEEQPLLRNLIETQYVVKQGKRVVPNDTFIAPTPVLINHREGTHVTVNLSVRTCALSSPDVNALACVRDVLGNYFSSRLNQILRVQHGLTYWVEVSHSYYEDTGRCEITFSVDRQQLNTALELLYTELKKLQQEGVTDEELTRVKTMLQSNFMRNHTSPRDHLTWYGEFLINEAPLETFGDYVKKIQKIEPSDIMRVVQAYFTHDRINLSLIGDAQVSDVVQYSD